MFVDKVINYLKADNLNSAFDELERIIQEIEDNTLLRNNFVLLKAQLSYLNKSRISGELSSEFLFNKTNQLRVSLIDLINEIPINHEIAKPVKNFTSLSSYNNNCVEITIKKNLVDYTINEQMKLLFAIQNILEIDGQIKIVRVTEGSIKITIELPFDKTDKLIKAFEQNLLDDFQIENIEIYNENDFSSEVTNSIMNLLSYCTIRYPQLSESEIQKVVTHILKEVVKNLNLDNNLAFLSKKNNDDYELSILSISELHKSEISSNRETISEIKLSQEIQKKLQNTLDTKRKKKRSKKTINDRKESK